MSSQLLQTANAICHALLVTAVDSAYEHRSLTSVSLLRDYADVRRYEPLNAVIGAGIRFETFGTT